MPDMREKECATKKDQLRKVRTWHATGSLTKSKQQKLNAGRHKRLALAAYST